MGKNKDFKNLSREKRKLIARELEEKGELYKRPLHEIEEILHIETIDNDYPKHMIISLSTFYKNESLENFEKRRKRTERKILNLLY